MESRIGKRPPAAAGGSTGAASTRGGVQALLLSLCGAGCGLVLWVALSSALLLGNSATQRKLVDLQAWGLGLGVVLAAAGLGLLLPRPAAPGRWWLRGLVALALLLASGATLALLQWHYGSEPGLLLAVAVVACASALATTAALALLDDGEAGPLLSVHLALALLGGAALFFAVMVLRWQGPLPPAGPVPSLALLVVVTAALLLALWQARGGLGSRLRSPRHWLVLGLVAGLPLLLAGLLYVWPGSAGAIWPLVALSVLAGSVLEYRQAH